MTATASGVAEYRRRVVDDDLDALLPGLSAISIEGPKGVGKTATALTRAVTVHQWTTTANGRSSKPTLEG